MRILQFTDYDPEWPKKFSREKALIMQALGSSAQSVEHIGSTSVPGMKAKPTIDILVTTDSLDEVDRASPELEKAGFSNLGEYGIPGRRYLRRVESLGGGNWVSTVHVHVFLDSDTENVERHLAVRDYLRQSPGEAGKYSQLKQSLLERCGNDLDCYISGKSEFVSALEKRALSWNSARAWSNKNSQ